MSALTKTPFILLALLLLTPPVLPEEPEEKERIELVNLAISNPAGIVFPDAPRILSLLQEYWDKRYGESPSLAYGPGKGSSLRVSILLRLQPEQGRILVTVITPERETPSVTSSIHLEGIQSLPSTLAGSLFYLWSLLSGFTNVELGQPPRLAGLLELDNLLPQQTEPTDCAACPSGVVVAFPDRILHLGSELEMIPRTAQDLEEPLELPPEFLITHLGLDPLNRIVFFDAGRGAAAYLDPISGVPEIIQTGAGYPADAAFPPGGGLALLESEGIKLIFRRRGELERKEVPLPHAAFTLLCADREGNLWVYDPQERRFRIYGPEGVEVRSVRPIISPKDLLFPQVFRLYSDGGFLLGGSEGLWRFDPRGLPLWKLSRFKAFYRESLPAFFRIAVTARGDAFFLLDPFSRRLLKFSEAGEDDPAELYARLEPDSPDSVRTLLRYYLEREHYSAAAHLLRPDSDPELSSRIDRMRDERVALCLAVRGQELEASLQLPEADRMYGHSLRHYRKLRGLDPVEPFYPSLIRGLTEKRTILRKSIYAEEVVKASLELVGIPAAGGGGWRVKLINRSSTALQEMRVSLHIPGLLPEPLAFEHSALNPGEQILLPVTLPPPGRAPVLKEDLCLRANLLIRYLRNGEQRSRYTALPFRLEASR